MKKYTTMIVFLVLSAAILAQGDRKKRHENYKALEIAYITDKLELTPEESQKFWPIHNAYKEALRDGRRLPKKLDSMALTDDEATSLVASRIEGEEKKLALKKEYFKDLLEVMPPQKVAMIFEIEHEFKRKVLRNIRENRKGR